MHIRVVLLSFSLELFFYHSHCVFLQDTEQLRNSVMFDLLYVHPHQNLAPYIISYYHYNDKVLSGAQRPWPIDANLRLVIWSAAELFNLFLCRLFISCLSSFCSLFYSGGMNGFIWLSERNGLRDRVPSPLNGLEDILNNKILWVSLWLFWTSTLSLRLWHVEYFNCLRKYLFYLFFFSFVARNITFLNPVPHKHIPQPPEGVFMPKKVCEGFA